MQDRSSTIVAVATPAGRGGLGCVRLSGDFALDIGSHLFAPIARGRQPRPGGPPCFGRFLSRGHEPLDHGYLVAFPRGASYTGEPTVELWAHGSPAVLDELLAAAVAAGATLAGPGEFTYRAVCNGRLDLARAEAVSDLVEARTLYQARVAFAQAEGLLATSLRPLTVELEEWIARGEAAVEFVEEVELSRDELCRAIDSLLDSCSRLLGGYARSRFVNSGATLAIVGLPNVGKSSLFNRLLARERAIVTASPGTTRDTLEEELDVEGIPLRLVDTAGLRQVDDEAEREGVRRAMRAREEADLVLLVLDGSRALEPLERQALARSLEDGARQRTLVAVNKCDLPEADGRPVPHPAALRVSARDGRGLEALRQELGARLRGTGPLEDPIVANRRQADALERARGDLVRARDAAADGLSEELLLEDLRAARRRLGEVTGEFANEALYDRIFSSFCIGK
jgi:tRNA modification GTPase